MNPVEKKVPDTEKNNMKNILRALPYRLWRSLLHNLPWKILALLLAIALWAGLITQDPTLTRERTFTDVPITIMGDDTLRRNGFIILSGLEEDALTARLRADVPQREYNTVVASNYNPRIDLTRITETGVQTLRVITSSTSSYGSVKEISPASLDIVVDEYVSNYRVPVTVQTTGQYPNGYYGTTPSPSPSSVAISGPKSIVDRISRVVVDFNVSRLPAQAGTSRTALPMRFTDVEGNAVQSDLLEVTSAGVLLHTIVVDQPLYASTTLPISSLALTTGSPAKGYELRNVSATPNVVVAAGDEAALAALDSLFLEQSVDITGASKSFTMDIRIRKPTELVYLSSDSVTLSIEISPTISVREFTEIPISIADLSKQRTINMDVKTASITLTGPSLDLNSLRSSALNAYIDVSDLPQGEHEIPISLKINSTDEKKFTYKITPATVNLQIAIK